MRLYAHLSDLQRESCPIFADPETQALLDEINANDGAMADYFG